MAETKERIFSYEPYTFLRAIDGLSTLALEDRDRLDGVHLGEGCMFASNGHAALLVLFDDQPLPASTDVLLSIRLCKAIAAAARGELLNVKEPAVVRVIDGQHRRIEVKVGRISMVFDALHAPTGPLEWAKIIEPVSAEPGVVAPFNLSLITLMRDTAAKVLGRFDPITDEDGETYHSYINAFVQPGSEAGKATRFDFYVDADTPTVGPIKGMVGVLMPLRVNGEEKTLRGPMPKTPSK